MSSRATVHSRWCTDSIILRLRANISSNSKMTVSSHFVTHHDSSLIFLTLYLISSFEPCANTSLSFRKFLFPIKGWSNRSERMISVSNELPKMWCFPLRSGGSIDEVVPKESQRRSEDCRPPRFLRRLWAKSPRHPPGLSRSPFIISLRFIYGAY